MKNRVTTALFGRLPAVALVRLASAFVVAVVTIVPPAISALGSDQGTATGAQLLASPDGRVELIFQLGPQGEPVYGVNYQGKAVLQASRLGFLVQDGAPLTNGFRLVKAERTRRDERWRPVAGERAEVRDHFHALTLQLVDSQTPPREMRLQFRAYNEGVALRYEFPGAAGGELTLTNELTEFRFTQDHACWPVYSAQGLYSRRPLSEVRPGCERPLTVDLGDGRWASVGEAALVDFARMRLRPSGQPNGVRADLAGASVLRTPGATPWRFLLLADSPGGLIERNDFALNLNEPCAIADTSWIHPGTVLRDISLTTDGATGCVDFAARMGIRYVLFDAGWYGHEYSDEADARAVNLDPKRSAGPFDLQRIIRYADQRGVGIILYVNRRAMEKQLDEILPLYAKWGVKGVKYGFVNVGSQRWTAWLHAAVRKAAENRLVVDIHDEYRPTGLSRTWPNLLTQEGVRGNEEWPPAAHNLVLPFTRLLAGPADCTFCWSDSRLKNTRTHQLAGSVVLFSPLQFLFWYDKPSQIAEEPALEFWRHLPTTWDDTRVLEGTPGDFIAVARRKGEAWYLGAMNGATPRQVEFKLDFLDAGKVYQALICADSPATEGQPARVQVEHRQVRRGDRLSGSVFANGGYAVRLTAGESSPGKTSAR